MIIYILVGLGFIVLCLLIKSIFMAMRDEDVKEASELRMTVMRYRLYKEIFEEQMECQRQGKDIPDRMHEIPNMNEWRRFCESQLAKQHKSMMDELDKIRNK